MALTRRQFLKSGCALGAGAMTLAVERFGLVNAFAQATDYKALVCVFLNGGNDSDNIVIPYDNYAEYAAVRDSGANVQIPQNSLLTINAPSVGAQFGFHPSLTGLHELYQQGKAAVVCDVGPLVEPTTRDTFRNGTARRPQNLFSHSDQQIQWQTSFSGGISQTGWGGRVADRMVVLNPEGGFPITVSVAGITIFSRGRTTQPLGLAPGVSLALEGFPTPPDGHPRYEALKNLLGVDTAATLVAAVSEISRQAVNNSQLLADPNQPPINTVFPNTSLGNQMLRVARLIKLNQTAPLNLKRQLFFCSLGGFDLHNNQVVAGNPTTGNHANLWTQVSQAMRAFYDATIELGVEPNVTTFTLSDFARTFKPNGGIGTDHGWGAHHFVMGGSVTGGNFYGRPAPNGTVFPPLVLGDGVDTDAGAGARGRWVPTVAVDQYAATLALWYGVAPADIPAVFPNSADGRFDPLNLGFLG